MVVRVEDARIEVEIDTRRAVAEVREIESQLELSRRRRRRIGIERVDTEREVRRQARGLGAAAGVGVGRALGGGLRQAIGFAARFGVGVGIVEILRRAPGILAGVLPQEVQEFGLPESFQSQFADRLVFDVLGLPRGFNVGNALREAAEVVANLQATVTVSVQAAQIAYNLLMEGKLAEAGSEAFQKIAAALGPSGPDGAKSLGVLEETGAVISAFFAYNRAEALFRQRAVGARYRQFIENQDQGFRAAGGGVSR